MGPRRLERRRRKQVKRMRCRLEPDQGVVRAACRRRRAAQRESRCGWRATITAAARDATSENRTAPHAMRQGGGLWVRIVPLVIAATVQPWRAGASTYRLVGWNNLGMHCMDGDYSVSALLPPYNTVLAQLIDGQGRLVRDPAGITVTYEAVADPDGSINSTSVGKTNFWAHVPDLFGVSLPDDAGLAGYDMPGAANQPQAMAFDPAAAAFVATGIPITPYDDAHRNNTYPLMRLVARDAGGGLLAASDVVLPVSDEMDCTSCHASGSSVAAQPSAGWVDDPDPQRDVRLNILLLHDDREASSDTFKSALAAAGYNSAGLFATATTDGKSVLCARCHLSEALPGSGLPGITPLTQAVHRRMAGVFDPVSGTVLGAVDNRSACYRCHPGTTTRCLRGAMGNAVAADGSRAMQCQSCHGSMLDVASTTRTGWLDEPACQNCHTGTAVSNSGQIRYSSAFDAPGRVRVAADLTFATNPDTPAAGRSLYRFSAGHGGLQCAACHGSTHAEFPSSQRNDNLQSLATQGHVGMLVECQSCHGTIPNTIDGGPHGMHPVGQVWVNRHPDAVGEEGGASVSRCQICHGRDYRGTVLSRVQADRTVTTEEFGSRQFWRGFQVGCYTCHLGPGGEGRNPNRPAVVSSTSASTSQDVPVLIPLSATDADHNALTLRIVSQPSHGTAGLNGATAEYFPDAGFAGSDAFTFAAWDGSTDSNLATVSVSVEPGATTSPSATVAVPSSATPTMPPSSTPSKAPSATATRGPTGVASPSPTPSRRQTASSTVPVNPTATAPASPPSSPTASAAATLAPTAPERGCVGDCDGNGLVTVDEVITGVNLVLGVAGHTGCAAFDCSGTGVVTIDCLVQAVNAARDHCPGTLLPTATSTGTTTAAQTPPIATSTPIASATMTATASASGTQRPTQTATAMPQLTATPTARATSSATAIPTRTDVPPSQSPTPTGTALATPTLAPPTPTATGSVNLDPTLANIQATIFSTSCTDAACHTSVVQAGGLVLEEGKAHDQLVGVPAVNVAAQQAGLLRVKPGDPSNSFLIIKLSGPVPAQGSPMPLGKPPLTAAQIQLIRDWITQGAAP
jgi:hypothetical protein